MRKKRGFFITFEGIDGSGKTTQAKKLVRYLKRKRIPVLFLREPGGTNVAEKLRQIVLKATGERIAPAAELFLYLAARAQIVQNRIAEARARGIMVICDRFSDSTVAYQAYGRGWNQKLIAELNAMASNSTLPELTLLLDLPVRVGLRRKKTALGGFPYKDRLESEGKSFHRRVRRGYLKTARAEPERIVVIDGTGSPETVWEEIRRVVDKKIA